MSYKTPTEIANKFNEYFSGIGSNQAMKINQNGTDFKKFMNDKFYQSLFLSPVNCSVRNI